MGGPVRAAVFTFICKQIHLDIPLGSYMLAEKREDRSYIEKNTGKIK